jgi:hypothetical protein
MKKDTQKPSQNPAPQTERTRKMLPLAKETLRELSGGNDGAAPEGPCVRPSQCPTLCF